MTLSGKGDGIKLKGLSRAFFVHNSRVTHIKSFLSKILKHIDNNIIKNGNSIELLGHEKIKKYDYESHSNENGADNCQDTMQDIAMSLSWRDMRVTDKIFSWITYQLR